MIGDITSKQIYDIEGTTSPLATGYEFTFPYPGADSIGVFTTGGLTDTAVTSTNWTVDASGATPKVVFVDGYTFPSGQTKLTIIRKVGYTQGLDLRNGDTIDADKLEQALDEIIMQVQQVEEKTTRAVLSSVSDTVQISIPDAGSRGGMLLGFNSTGAAVPVLTTDIQQKLTQALAAETHTITLEGQAQGAKADAVAAKTAAQAAQLAAETAQSGAEAAQTASQGLYDSIETKTTESLGTINTAKTTAVGAVTTQQATSVAAVEAAQATALSEISTAKTTATGAVTSARTTAVSAVQSQQSTSVGAVQSAQSSAVNAIASYGASMETALDTYTDGKKDEISSWTDTKKGEVTSAATTGVTSVQSAATTAEGNLDDHVGETSDTGTTTLMGKLNTKTASSVATLEAMIETIPQDYSSLSLKAKECTYRIENLEAMAKGELYTEHTETTSGGVLALPSSSPLAPWAEVEKVVGKTEAYMSVDLGSLTWGAYGNRMYTEIPNVVSDTPNISSNRLVKASWGDTGEVANTMVMSGTTLYANNNGITDASAFKTAMNGVTLRYDGTSNSLHSSTLSKVVSKDSDGETMQSVTLPSLTLKGVGSACDTYLPSTGKVQRKVGSIDLGSLTWSFASSSRFWYLQYEGIKGYASTSATENLLSVNYPTHSRNSMGDHDVMICTDGTFSPPRIVVKNGATSSSDPAPSGMLYYEKATYTEETSTTIDPYIAVEAGGSVSVVSTNAQAEASVHYLTDLT